MARARAELVPLRRCARRHPERRALRGGASRSDRLDDEGRLRGAALIGLGGFLGGSWSPFGPGEIECKFHATGSVCNRLQGKEVGRIQGLNSYHQRTLVCGIGQRRGAYQLGPSLLANRTRLEKAITTEDTEGHRGSAPI
jgi:hypothetical protein